MLIVAFMEKNQLRSAIVSSRTRFGAKELESLNLVFIPSALYAYLLGHNTIEQRR